MVPLFSGGLLAARRRTTRGSIAPSFFWIRHVEYDLCRSTRCRVAPGAMLRQEREMPTKQLQLAKLTRPRLQKAVARGLVSAEGARLRGGCDSLAVRQFAGADA